MNTGMSTTLQEIMKAQSMGVFVSIFMIFMIKHLYVTRNASSVLVLSSDPLGAGNPLTIH